MKLYEINEQILNCIDTETGEIIDIEKLIKKCKELEYAAVAITDEPYQFFNLKEEDWYFSFGPSFRFSIQQFPLRLLFANTFKIKDGSPVFTDQDGDGDYNWRKNWNFVLSFSMTNR